MQPYHHAHVTQVGSGQISWESHVLIVRRPPASSPGRHLNSPSTDSRNIRHPQVPLSLVTKAFGYTQQRCQNQKL